MKSFKTRLLTKINNVSGYNEKLEILNREFLKAKTKDHEDLILDMINQLKFWGK